MDYPFSVALYLLFCKIIFPLLQRSHKQAIIQEKEVGPMVAEPFERVLEQVGNGLRIDAHRLGDLFVRQVFVVTQV